MRVLDLGTDIRVERREDARLPQQPWGEREEQVLSNITHDLRAPLCAIMGYLDLAGRQVEQAAPDKVVEYLSLAREAGLRMNQMVNDMLDMFRFENGQSFLQPQRIPVSALLEKVRKTFTGMADLKKLRLSCSIDRPSLMAWADPRYLGRALDNLVANAIKFTPPGGCIDVFVRGGPERTVFEVSDTGRGIPPEARKRIFEKFQHARATDQRRGYGMGLAVVKMVLKAHHGAISVKSQVGKGSRFTFWIPNHSLCTVVNPSV